MERMLLYSLERRRAIRLMYLDGGGALRQVTAVVTAMEDGRVKLYVLRPPQDLEIDISDILSADYRKGDEGQE